MSEADDTNPTPRLKTSERRVLAYLREHADADGCCPRSRRQISEDLDVAASTVQVAIGGLVAAGLLERQINRGGGVPNAYCVTPEGMTDDRPIDRPTDRPMIDRPTPKSVSPLARAHGSPPLTPNHGESGSLDLSTTDRLTDDRPTDLESVNPESVNPLPVGQLAVRAAMEAASAAGGSVPAALRPRIGHAAQALAKDESIETILAAARRLGEGGFEDLYTAVRAVKQERPMPVAVRTAQPAVPIAEGKMGRVLERLYGTWPRSRGQISVPLWEEKLGRIQERFLVAAIDRIAQDGGDFAPTWGKVWKVAHEIGQPIVGAERSEAARLRERARLDAIG